MPTHRPLLSLILSLAAVAPLAAQEPPAPRSGPPLSALPPDPLQPLTALGAALALPAMDFVVSELGGKVVKGAPYSAEAVSETVQVLADGNRIVRRHVTRLARDGEGRTRQERLVDGKVASVYINDVVAGRGWVLSPESKRARELRFGPRGAPLPPPAAGSEEMRSWSESMREWGREFSARFRAEQTAIDSTDGARRNETVTRVVGPDGNVREVHVHVTTDRRVQASGAAASAPASPGAAPVPPAPPAATAMPPLPPLPPIPPVAALLPPPGDGVTTSLGAREFDGVRADGTRTVWTIAAGRIGNEKPIEIASERWYAPDLMLVVQTRRTDPRSGETSYRLTNLKRGEPDAALFKVPAEYEQRGDRGR